MANLASELEGFAIGHGRSRYEAFLHWLWGRTIFRENCTQRRRAERVYALELNHERYLKSMLARLPLDAASCLDKAYCTFQGCRSNPGLLELMMRSLTTADVRRSLSLCSYWITGTSLQAMRSHSSHQHIEVCWIA